MRMKKQMAGKALLGMIAALLVLTFGLLLDGFAQVAMAATQGKITASSVNVRKEASAGSTVVAGAERNDVVTVNGQVTGSDGKVWYKVEVDGVDGYIRSDLMSVTEGEVPEATEPTAEVTEVEPISGKVTGGQLIRVRGDASTDSRIVTTVANGVELTITGEAQGADGKTWYQVKFTKDGAQVTGFIREDFVNPSGVVTPVTETQEPEDPVVQQPEDPVVQDSVVEETKDWETSLQDDTWYLIDNVNAKKYMIEDMLQGATTNAQLYYESQDTVKGQKIAIIILVILLLGVIGAGAFLFYKMKDENDAAYINAVEKETMNRRSAQAGSRPTGRPEGRPSGRAEGQRVMHNVGPDKSSAARPTGQSGQRPAGQPGQRPAGQPGQRPAGQPGQRPTGQPGQRPAGQPGQRPAGQPGQRPAGQPGQRPTGQPGQRPAGQPGQRPAGQPGQRPAGQPVQRPQSGGVESGAASQEREAHNKPAANAESNWKSKNFMTDEDEFEFDFLNWDGSEEQ